MILRSLSLEQFRNYEALQLQFDPGVNLIVGNNAQGKTNLLEGVFYLAAGRSFRTRKEQELIRFAAENAQLEAAFFSREREQTMRAILFSGRRPRQLFLNGVKKKTYTELSGSLTCVLFCPEDLQVLKTGAADRRRLIDQALCQLRPRYDSALTEYGRLQQQKSRILKDRFEKPGLLEVLPEYDTRMAQLSAVILKYRAAYLQKLKAEAAAYHAAFSGGKEAFDLQYKTISTVTDPFASLEQVTGEVWAHQQSHHGAELESMQCLTGVHKDDFSVSLNGIDLKAYGSQGQTRTAAISLKLAERVLFQKDTGQMPILLLDDVLSELDPGRQDFVLNQIREGQVLITCCEQEKLTTAGQTITIDHGTLQEVRVGTQKESS